MAAPGHVLRLPADARPGDGAIGAGVLRRAAEGQRGVDALGRDVAPGAAGGDGGAGGAAGGGAGRPDGHPNRRGLCHERTGGGHDHPGRAVPNRPGGGGQLDHDAEQQAAAGATRGEWRRGGCGGRGGRHRRGRGGHNHRRAQHRGRRGHPDRGRYRHRRGRDRRAGDRRGAGGSADRAGLAALSAGRGHLRSGGGAGGPGARGGGRRGGFGAVQRAGSVWPGVPGEYRRARPGGTQRRISLHQPYWERDQPAEGQREENHRERDRSGGRRVCPEPEHDRRADGRMVYGRAAMAGWVLYLAADGDDDGQRNYIQCAYLHQRQGWRGRCDWAARAAGADGATGHPG